MKNIFDFIVDIIYIALVFVILSFLGFSVNYAYAHINSIPTIYEAFCANNMVSPFDFIGLGFIHIFVLISFLVCVAATCYLFYTATAVGNRVTTRLKRLLRKE